MKTDKGLKIVTPMNTNATTRLMMIVVGLCAATTALANPVVSGAANLTPSTLGGGDVATFTFSFTNANTSESAPMTNVQLQISVPEILVNGVPRHLSLLGVSAVGGSVSYTDEDGEVTEIIVDYGTLSKGSIKTVAAMLQMPYAGLVNGASVQANGTLTWEQTPGLLALGATASLEASPLVHVELVQAPLYVSPSGHIEYRVQYDNEGSGIDHRAYVIVPVHPNTRLVRVGVGSARSQSLSFRRGQFSLIRRGNRHILLH